MNKTLTITDARASELMFTDGHPGFCEHCGYFDEYAGCEPDARKYHCPECDTNNLMGFEEALVCGLVEIVG